MKEERFGDAYSMTITNYESWRLTHGRNRELCLLHISLFLLPDILLVLYMSIVALSRKHCSHHFSCSGLSVGYLPTGPHQHYGPVAPGQMQ